jgi:hypothetical protein
MDDDGQEGGSQFKLVAVPRSVRIWIALGVSSLPFIVCVLHGYAVDCDSKYAPDFCGMTTMRGFLFGSVGSLLMLLISLPFALRRSASVAREE